MKNICPVLFCIACAATASYGGSPFSFSGSSGKFVVDTRPDVVINDVTSAYCSGEYGGQGGTCATFLAGVHCDVEFRIHASGRDGNPISHYLVNGQRHDMDTFTFGMGDLSPHGILQVVGVDYAGKRSDPFRVNVEIAPLPPKWNYNPLIGTIVVADKHPRQGLVIYRTLVISPLALFKAEFDEVEFGEKPSSFEFSPNLHIDETVDTSTGQYCFGAEAGYGIGSKAKTSGKAGSFDILDISYGLKGGLALNYNPQTGNWDMGYNELGVSFNGSVKVRKRLPQFPLVYGEFGLASAASLMAHYEDGEWHSEIALSPLVAIRATAGIGVEPILAAEVSGEAGIYLEASRPGGIRRGYLRGEVFWRAVLATHERSGTWWEGELDIYRRPGLSSVGPDDGLGEARLRYSPRLAALCDASALPGGGYADSGFKPISRNYGNGAVPAVRRASALKLLDASQAADDVQILMHDGYPVPQPAIAAAGTKAAVAYVRDNAARSDLDRTEIVFREELADGRWSGETHIWDDGTADFHSKLALLPDGTAIAAWANAKRRFEDGTPFETVCASLESAVGVRDPQTGTWTCANLTDDTALDWLPVLKGATNGTAAVAWVRNTAGAYIGTAARPSDLAVSFYRNGSWSPASVAAAGTGAVFSHDIAWDGEKAFLVWAKDADGDLSTEDSEIWATSYENGVWSAPVRLSGQSAAAMHPFAWHLPGGEPHVAWVQKGALFAADGLAEASGACVSAEVSIPNDCRISVCENGEATLLWATGPGESETGLDGGIMSAGYVPGTGLAAPALLLRRKSSLLRNMSGSMDGDGTFRAAFESVAVSTNAEGRLVQGAVDLAVCRRGAAPDVGVAADGCSFAANVETGVTNTISVGIQNHGTVASGSFEYRVWEGEGEDKVLLAAGQAGIPPLSRELVEVPWTPAEGLTNVAFTIELDPGNQIDDPDRENNTLIWRPDVGSPVLSLRNAKAVKATDTLRLVSARIHNDAVAPLPAGMVVKFWRGEIGGELIGTDTAGLVAGGDAGEYDVGVAWDVSGAAFTSEWERIVIELPAEQGGRSVAVWTPTPLYDPDGDIDPGGGTGGGDSPSAPPNIGGIVGFGEVDGSRRFHFCFHGEAGFVYHVQHKEKLTDAEWTTIETVTPATTGECPVAVPVATSAPSGFYRIVTDP